MNNQDLPLPLKKYPFINDWIRFQEVNDKESFLQVFTGRVELGQGICTVIQHIVSREFSLPLNKIQVISGDTTKSPDEGYTAGSLSVSQGAVSVRYATRAAKHIILAKASELLQAQQNDVALGDEQIMHNGQPSELCFWMVAKTCSFDVTVKSILPALAPDKTIKNKIPAPTILPPGFAPNNLLDRLNGKAFLHDLHLPEKMHARVILPPSRNLTLQIDSETLIGYLPDGTSICRKNDFLAVVCVREELAVKAANKLNSLNLWGLIDTDGLDSPINPGHTHAINGISFETSIDYEHGHIESAENQTTVKAIVERPCLLHASIGPSCAVAHLVGERLTVWSHSQGVFHLRTSIAAMLNLDLEQVDVIHMPGAGCYGHNGADDVAADAAIVACERPGIPIRLMHSREQEFNLTPRGPAMRTSASARLKANDKGRLMLDTVCVDVTSPAHSTRPGSGGGINLRSYQLLQTDMPRSATAFISSEPPLSAGGGSNRNAVPGYNIPNVKVTNNKLLDIPYRASSLRALGAFNNVLAIESMMDRAAQSANSDPLSFRLAHLSDQRAIDVLTKAANLADYKPDIPNSGISYARYKNSAAYCACVASVEIDTQVKVTDLWLAVDAGEVLNPDGIKAQIEGGAIQAISWLLLENADKENADKENANKKATGKEMPDVQNSGLKTWDDYPILSFSEIPNIEVELAVDKQDQPPLGCGEASQGPVAAAVYNAICKLLEIHPTQLPLTREQLMDILVSQ